MISFLDGFNTVLHAAFVGFITLFPVVDPIGTAFIVNPYFRHLPLAQRKLAIRKIAWYSLLTVVGSLFIGRWILMLFGLSIPVVKLAGGIMICKMGWASLSSTATSQDSSANSANSVESAPVDTAQPSSVENDLFYPLSFPLTVGPGTISVVLALSAHSYNESNFQSALSTAGLIVGMAGMSALIYLCYLNAGQLVARLGAASENMINRFMAFLIFAVGLQIAWGGLHTLIKSST
jgi:multiple antibiotic resistance protein